MPVTTIGCAELAHGSQNRVMLLKYRQGKHSVSVTNMAKEVIAVDIYKKARQVAGVANGINAPSSVLFYMDILLLFIKE